MPISTGMFIRAKLYRSEDALAAIYKTDSLEAARAKQALSQASLNAFREEDLRKQRIPILVVTDVEAKISQALGMLALLHRRMPRAIIDAVKLRIPARMKRFYMLETVLTKAIDDVRAREEHIFRNLKTITGPNALETALAGQIKEGNQ
jgi:hypothetical protein